MLNVINYSAINFALPDIWPQISYNSNQWLLFIIIINNTPHKE